MLSVHLTDAPAPYERVDVEIATIELHPLGGERWVSVVGSPQRINLLALQGGVELLLRSLSIEPGGYDAFRFAITGASITQSGVRFPAAVRASTVVVTYPFEVRAGDHVDVLLDFDALSSLSVDEDGNIAFSPQIRVKREARK